MAPDETLPLEFPGHGTKLDGVLEDEGLKYKELTLGDSSPRSVAVHLKNPNGQVDEVPRNSTEVVEPVEEDVIEWHPLEHIWPDSVDINQPQDTTFVEDSIALGSDEKHLPVAAPQSQTSNSNLRIDPKPPSPQPWDIAEPSNHGEGTDYYSTLGTKNFGTLQKNRFVSSQFLTPASVLISYYPHIAVHDHLSLILHITLDLPQWIPLMAQIPLVTLVYTTHAKFSVLSGIIRVVSLCSSRQPTHWSLKAGYVIHDHDFDFWVTYYYLQITPTQFLVTINAINELLISAHSIRHSFINNVLAVFTLQISRLFVVSHYEKVWD